MAAAESRALVAHMDRLVLVGIVVVQLLLATAVAPVATMRVGKFPLLMPNVVPYRVSSADE